MLVENCLICYATTEYLFKLIKQQKDRERKLIWLLILQEFCLFAVVGLVSDFFLQMFFFTTVLSIDIRRMEVRVIFIFYTFPVHFHVQPQTPDLFSKREYFSLFDLNVTETNKSVARML